MIFMFFFYCDEVAFADLPREKMNRVVDAHYTYNHEVLEKRANVLATRGLQPSRTSVTVEPHGDEKVVRRAPAVTADMAVNGFYLLECADWDEAIALAREYPMMEGLGRIEIRPAMADWDYAPSVDSPARADSIWRLYTDASTWPMWKHGVEKAEIDGPFREGATGWLTPVGQAAMPYRITEAEQDVRYVSETELAAGVVLRMVHELTPLPSGGTRITHQVTMPRGALDLFGMHFSGDFNTGVKATLQALSTRARALEGEGESS
jgi:hypothetical protein